ncbi:MAG: hypothetical protein Q4C42_03055 [Clostridia bacterium]|nr:hypothetical protein [Clostridia bacterium]
MPTKDEVKEYIKNNGIRLITEDGKGGAFDDIYDKMSEKDVKSKFVSGLHFYGDLARDDNGVSYGENYYHSDERFWLSVWRLKGLWYIPEEIYKISDKYWFFVIEKDELTLYTSYVDPIEF